MGTIYCRKCGYSVPPRTTKCPNCETLLLPENVIRDHSWAWILVPIFFGFIGGIIAYFAVKEDDKREANQYLIIGIILTVIGIIAWGVLISMSLSHMSGLR